MFSICIKGICILFTFFTLPGLMALMSEHSRAPSFSLAAKDMFPQASPVTAEIHVFTSSSLPTSYFSAYRTMRMTTKVRSRQEHSHLLASEFSIQAESSSSRPEPCRVRGRRGSGCSRRGDWCGSSYWLGWFRRCSRSGMGCRGRRAGFGSGRRRRGCTGLLIEGHRAHCCRDRLHRRRLYTNEYTTLRRDIT
jgi:hypothetical protein